MCQETKQQEIKEITTEDTWSGMPWGDFIRIATEQGFQVAYQKRVSEVTTEEEIESILYRKDGLLLYATSFNGTLNRAIIEGEMGSTSYHVAKQVKLPVNYYVYNDGPYTFCKGVQDGFVQFLKKLQGIPITTRWIESRRVLHALNSQEEAIMMQDREEVQFAKKRAIQIQKLSKCCDEVKQITNAVLRVPEENEVHSFMLWKSFLKTIEKQGFQLGYQNKFIDIDGSEQAEVILYHLDGLLLYAYSEGCCLAKATLYGEVTLSSKKEQKRFAEYCEIENCENGITTFTRNACESLNRTLLFLKEFELHREWGSKVHSLKILNRAEREFLKETSKAKVQEALVVRTKLLRCHAGAKKVMNVMLGNKASFSQEVFTTKKNFFHFSRKYNMG